MDELTDFEKLIESTHQIAAVMRTYYEELIGNGFCHEDAMLLTIQFQKDVLNLAKPNNKSNQEE